MSIFLDRIFPFFVYSTHPKASLIISLTDKVDHWKNSHQRQRWVASVLLDIEPRLRRIKGYRHLAALHQAL
jgi:hypothetical protein